MVCDGRGISRFGAPLTYKRARVRKHTHTHKTLLLITSLQNVCNGMLNYEPLLYFIVRAIAGTLAAVFASRQPRVFCPWCFVCLFFFVVVQSRHNRHHHHRQQQQQYCRCLVIVIGFLVRNHGTIDGKWC